VRRFGGEAALELDESLFDEVLDVYAHWPSCMRSLPPQTPVHTRFPGVTWAPQWQPDGQPGHDPGPRIVDAMRLRLLVMVTVTGKRAGDRVTASKVSA
jgi:hypothetical protein